MAYLPDTLKFLALGSTQRRFSLAPIARFRKLAELYLEGHTKDIDVLSGFVDLVYLTLRSISLPDLSLLKPLRHLRSLDLKLGGTKDLSMLGVLGQLRYLELWMIRGLSDLSAVAELGELRYLFLQDLKNVSRLPSFATLHNLQRVHIENLKNLSDLRPIAVAPRLEELLLINMGHLTLDDLKCFCNHPTLKEAVVGLGSVRRNEAAASLLGLPTISNFKTISQYIEPDVMRDGSSENRER